MPKSNKQSKRKPKPDDKKQSQRFVETARKLEVDESGKKFNRAIDIIRKKRTYSSRSGKDN